MVNLTCELEKCAILCPGPGCYSQLEWNLIDMDHMSLAMVDMDGNSNEFEKKKNIFNCITYRSTPIECLR